MARSRLSDNFGNCGVTHSSGLQTLLTRQGPDLLANPPDQRLLSYITAEFPTTDLPRKSGLRTVNDHATSNCGLLHMLIAAFTHTGPSINKGVFKISVKPIPLQFLRNIRALLGAILVTFAAPGKSYSPKEFAQQTGRNRFCPCRLCASKTAEYHLAHQLAKQAGRNSL